MKRWILLHLFPDLAGYLRMVAQYDEPGSTLARDLVARYELGKEADD